MKKFLAVLISVIFIFSSFGMVFVSAATNDEAEAAAEAFNNEKVDYTKEYLGKMKESHILFCLDKMDDIIAKILAKKDVKGSFYSDSVVTLLGAKLAGITKTDFKSVDYPAVKADFPEAYAYIEQAKSEGKEWDTIGVIPFGVKDKETFINALGDISANFGGIIALACALVPTLYDSGLVSLVESLHVGKMPTSNEYLVQTEYDGAKTMKLVAGYLVGAFEGITAKPVSYILDVLPDLVVSYGDFAEVISSDPFCAGLGLSLPALDELVGKLTESLADDGITLPEMDLEKLAGMATARAVESGAPGGYDVELNGDRAIVFSAIVRYLNQALADEGNQKAIKNMLRRSVGITDADYEALLTALKNFDVRGIVNALGSILDLMVEKDALPGFLGSIIKFFQKIVKTINALFAKFAVVH